MKERNIGERKNIHWKLQTHIYINDNGIIL